MIKITFVPRGKEENIWDIWLSRRKVGIASEVQNPSFNLDFEPRFIFSGIVDIIRSCTDEMTKDELSAYIHSQIYTFLNQCGYGE